MKTLIRPIGSSASTAIIAHLRPAVAHRSYATQHAQGQSGSSTTKRRAVTPFNDDGHVPWHQLSAGEKTSRAAQQSFNFGLVIVGLVMTGGVGYFLFQDVFSPESKTAYFNRAVDKIRKDPDCVRLLGQGNKIEAHGDETHNKWRRARPIASTLNVDKYGTEHLMIHFYVEGPLNRGTANVHLTRPRGREDFDYKYFFVDIKGHSRIFLEDSNSSKSSGDSKKFKLFGVSWS